MLRKLAFALFLAASIAQGQSWGNWKNHAGYFSSEFFVGKTMEAYDGFPAIGLQRQLYLGLGRDHANNPQQWARHLSGIKTAFSLGITDFGNLDTLGYAVLAMPQIEFKAFNSQDISILTGLGISYFSKKFHHITNPQNRAVTTDLTWAFRLALYYRILTLERSNWRVGLAYSHHSNGHTRLMNNGYNSFTLGLSAQFGNASVSEQLSHHDGGNRFTSDYFSLRAGLGKNVFALPFNERRDVYVLAGEYGRVYKNSLKLGIGFYYRFYQHYYRYIVHRESLVQNGREFDYFQGNPVFYASNLGISVQGEILLNHWGIEMQLGYNFHKPAYKLEWRINEGWENPPKEIDRGWQLGEYNVKYKMKYRFATRLGLKYYILGNERRSKNDVFIGAHLNANLGQADFSEVSIGYIRRFSFREIKKI